MASSNVERFCTSHGHKIIIITVIISSCWIHTFGLVISSSNSVFVKLDPYVSILDKENPSRYNVQDLQPFIAKVATRFRKIYVEFSDADLKQDLNTSLSLLPIAIANFNKMSNRTTPLEVWLGIEDNVGKVLDSGRISSPLLDKLLIGSFQQGSEYDVMSAQLKKQTILQMQKFKFISNQANNAFNGTVTTFLFSTVLRHFSINYPELPNFFDGPEGTQYQLGITVDPNDILPHLCNLEHVNSDMIVTTVVIMVTPWPQVSAHTFPKGLPDCKNMSIPYVTMPNGTNTHSFILSIPDSNGYKSSMNRSRLVSNWLSLEDWTHRTGIPLILSSAFDTPYKSTVHKKTDGWWRFIENPNYITTQDYKFENKGDMVKYPDEKNNFNISWLEKKTSFKRDYTGVIFSLYQETLSNPPTLSDFDLKPILSGMENHFSKVVLVMQSNSGTNFLQNVKEKSLINRIQDKVEVVILFLPNVDFGKQIYKELYIASSSFTLVIPYNSNATRDTANLMRDYLIKLNFKDKMKFGRLFPMTVCGVLETDNEELYDKVLKNPELQVIYFSFEEDEETVKLGANRMFQQRIVLFEQCKQFIIKRGVSETTEVVFIMMHYGTSKELYQNDWELQNLVRYWEMLSDWAGTASTAVIFSNAMDGSRILKKGNAVFEAGWWRAHNLNGNGISLKNQKMWSNKREDALQIVQLRDSEENKISSGLETVTIGFIVLTTFAFVFCVFLVVLFFMKRHYRDKYLTTTEIDYFFLGNQSVGLDAEDENHAQSVPYDKDRFEIDKDTFSIDDGPPLGSGEFGQVCRGKVNKNGESMSVAIKTVNPEKITKTALSGLLSEIKLLAFLGKHENIIELVGANTADLEDGKVFVFLELCQLGSLEKHLRNLRPTSECSQDRMGFENNGLYENTTSFEAVTLDQALSDDLYRWSKEICNGMAYLATKHVVHADVASRNVLLNLRKEVKICDFGLSRKMYNYTNYVKKQQEPLPWKWMSPESLRLMQFNEKSDVWAYGVTLWEIYSLGDSPYQGLSWDAGFSRMLELGFRLGEPQFNDRDMYKRMGKCWITNPTGRPTFTELLAGFQ